ncbi:MAG: hypothetical protein ACI915_001617 [Gammaproteobacteria bacterium]|jgi:hypothetical protein
MTLYSDSTLLISAATTALHEDELLSFARPGTWGTAAQRTAIAAQARSARCEVGEQESINDEKLADAAELPEAARRVARAVALGGIDVDKNFCEQAQADGVTEGAYVEIVGLVARLAHLDVFARGIGLPSRRLLDPVEDKMPSMERPSEAKKEGFFTASIPSSPEGGNLARSLFGDQPAPNILRSLSLVPDEARRLIRVIDEEYFSTETMMNLTYSSHDAISRPQLELVAAKVSELNQCFY